MSDLLLDVRGLSVDVVRPDGETVRILHDVDLAVGRGTVMGVVGESGSGKTMLLRALMRILPDRATASFGRLAFDGAEVGASARAPRLPIAMVFQDPLTSFDPLRRIGGHLTEVVRRFQGVRGAEARRRASAALDDVGIPDPDRVLRQFPHELSGGMRQRALIAMALLARPEILVADEPTTALDATIQTQILALLARLQREQGLTIVIVTHDLGVVAALCDRVTVMKDGHVVETGATETVFADPQHPYTRELLAATPGAETHDD
ncbi:ABC-type dipeptide/oligopeptide/nickel transport system ATPase component [Microbacterium resistens]|uniref:ABC-type dipeptide/oligopeptide/nickel transport system ATPase component n=1 Tax=Microbacterium resistens TaxID=156977 RepID=A0ABU1SFK5_9MICO|nr:ABC transporter ATP-binding protein [Microbacterium resistens]MDR6868376.1 ABC-type dipeptide/oligopeptide/nickel transport system ATPase component [Microbacterium resistens]